MQSRNNWRKQYDKLREKFAEHVTQYYNQEECPEFREMIDLVLTNRTENEIDFHGLTKYQVAILLEDLFDELATEMNFPREYNLVVGSGTHSDKSKGPQLPKKTLETCKRDYGVDIRHKTKAVLVVELTPEFAERMGIIRDLKRDLQHLQEFTNPYEVQTRFINGFGKTEFKPIVADFWKDNLRDSEKENVLEIVWEKIINLVSNKFIAARTRSLLSQKNPQLMDRLSKLFEKRPKSLRNFIEASLKGPLNLHVIYTFTPAGKDLNLKDTLEDQPFSEHFSLKSADAAKLLKEERHHLFWRFDERKDTKAEPFFKMVQLVKEEVDRNKPSSKHLFFIIHLIKDSNRETNIIPYDSRWSQCMIDSLIDDALKN